MAAAAAAASAVSSRGVMRIFGIDPGTVNCGLCEYDATNKKAISLERLEFRATGTAGNDIGNARIVNSVRKWIFDNEARFMGVLVFIENQPPDRSEEVKAVQYAFQAILGERCVPVPPSGVKARYPETFPDRTDLHKFKAHYRQQRQYDQDKRNAILRGREEVPKHVRDEYESKNPAKKDDAYDAYFIAKYAADFLIDDTGEVREKALPVVRRKRGDIHPRGKPMMRAAAKAKASKAKAKASKAKAKAKASAGAGKRLPKRKAEEEIVILSDTDSDFDTDIESDSSLTEQDLPPDLEDAISHPTVNMASPGGPVRKRGRK